MGPRASFQRSPPASRASRNRAPALYTCVRLHPVICLTLAAIRCLEMLTLDNILKVAVISTIGLAAPCSESRMTV
jgi:hypothetical protein